jgi:hypothetical protein
MKNHGVLDCNPHANKCLSSAARPASCAGTVVVATPSPTTEAMKNILRLIRLLTLTLLLGIGHSSLARAESRTFNLQGDCLVS